MNEVAKQKSKRRWLRFGLRTLLITTLCVSLAFGWLARERRRSNLIKRVVKAGEVVFLPEPTRTLRGWLRPFLGKYVSRDVDAMRLDYAHVTDEDMEVVALFNETRSIDLIDNPVSDAGLRSIAGLRGLKELKIGGQYAEQVTDRGMRSLRNLRSLELLELRQTSIQGSGLGVLKRMPNLKTLSLWKSSVDTSAMEHLKQLTQIEKLVVGRTNLTHSDIEELRESLPNCLIVGDI